MGDMWIGFRRRAGGRDPAGAGGAEPVGPVPGGGAHQASRAAAAGGSRPSPNQ
jgi:hypothetical protein